MLASVFRTVIVYVAVITAMRLTGNPQVMQQEYQLYQATINSARLQDAREKMTEPVYDSSYGLARRGRWYG